MTDHQAKIFATHIGTIYKAKINDKFTLSFDGGVRAEFVSSGGTIYINGAYAGLCEGAAQKYAEMVSAALAKTDLRAAAMKAADALERLEFGGTGGLKYAAEIRAALGSSDSVERLCDAVEVLLVRIQQNAVSTEELKAIGVALAAVRKTAGPI